MHTQPCQEACHLRHNDCFFSYPATAKLLMRDRRDQAVNIGHCYSNIIEDAQHHFKIHFQSEVVHNVFQAATREGLSHLQMQMCLDKANFQGFYLGLRYFLQSNTKVNAALYIASAVLVGRCQVYIHKPIHAMLYTAHQQQIFRGRVLRDALTGDNVRVRNPG